MNTAHAAPLTPIPPSSVLFSELQYSLRVELKATTAQIVTAHLVANSHAKKQFERNYSNGLTLKTWVEVGQLKKAGLEFAPQGYTLAVGERGARFSFGRLKLDPGNTQKNAVASSRLHKLLLVEVAVGRARVLPKKLAEGPLPTLPTGYTSFIVTNEGSATFEYIITKTSQVLPVCLAEVEFDPEAEKKSREKPSCDNCEATKASVYCAADNANLCSDCDSLLHAAKLTRRHNRVSLEQNVVVFGNCQSHGDKPVEFYCHQCHLPVCVVCKMTGSHSVGDAASHKLLRLDEAYQAVIAETALPDKALIQRKTKIDNHISMLEDRAKAVHSMAEALRSQIDQIYKCACHELDDIVMNKLDTLRGDELELRRQIAEIDRLDDFVGYQKKQPTQFLLSYSQLQQQKSELHDFRYFREKIDVQCDTKVKSLVYSTQLRCTKSPL
ncbi:hypothetical protein M427DRAFT_504927 [Gonapodya prolifera JEL478]|uniref:B box-type domain-containing protein n=1 Tax=Gonapodya prolifera (strain JEL478) TaxID=1344416 RepID=A0A139AT26_GONPJ|nr:hypothetical protein M427DRAFT_504927 [Gonapodya prolifera JEL478]|eukprot:KXS19890.1 hypothetical protein M427DRAFT_504927 [Gonapodya prolifera JEL478]